METFLNWVLIIIIGFILVYLFVKSIKAHILNQELELEETERKLRIQSEAVKEAIKRNEEAQVNFNEALSVAIRKGEEQDQKIKQLQKERNETLRKQMRETNKGRIDSYYSKPVTHSAPYIHANTHNQALWEDDTPSRSYSSSSYDSSSSSDSSSYSDSSSSSDNSSSSSSWD